MYYLRISKMYLKSVYVNSSNPETYYIDELELTSDFTDIFDSAKFKTYKKADYTKDILSELLILDKCLIDIIKEEDVSDE